MNITVADVAKQMAIVMALLSRGLALDSILRVKNSIESLVDAPAAAYRICVASEIFRPGDTMLGNRSHAWRSQP